MKTLFINWIKVSFIILLFFSIPICFASEPLNAFLTVLPNDPLLEQQYYLEQIDAIGGWDIVKESPEVVVAIIDSGVDIEHPDLADNIWRNADEVPNDKIDNDHNGYADDYYGWDFILNIPDPKPKFGGKYTNLGINHGTIVAGVIGAMTDNRFGISGISWKIKIMPLKVMDGEGAGSTDSVYKAIKYAINNGADIINLSIVGDVYDPQLNQIIKEAYQKGIVIVASAGNETNSAGSNDISLNLGLHPQYPICNDGDEGNNYIIGVGAVDYLDVKSKFTNYGSKCIDLVAPGEYFYGTLFFSPVVADFNKYFGGYWSGTSLAAPQVSAAAALIKAVRPDLLNSDIYDLILNNADNIDGKNPNYAKLLGSGRLNVFKALTAAKNFPGGGTNLIVAPFSQHTPNVITLNYLGQKISEFLAYASNFLGGVNLAAADFDNNGQKEIITGAGSGGGPHIKVFSADGSLLGHFFAYESNFTGGVNVTAGNVDNDDQLEIITVPQSNYKPIVKIFTQRGVLKGAFFAFSQNYSGGVNIALSDINADGVKEIIAAPAGNYSPEIKIFNSSGKLLKEFLAYGQDYKSGIRISAFNLYGDPRTEIITAPQNNYSCLVKVFSPSGDIINQFVAGDSKNKFGCNLAVGNINSGLEDKIIIGTSKGEPSKILIYSKHGVMENSYNVFEDNFFGGVNVILK